MSVIIYDMENANKFTRIGEHVLDKHGKSIFHAEYLVRYRPGMQHYDPAAEQIAVVVRTSALLDGE